MKKANSLREARKYVKNYEPKYVSGPRKSDLHIYHKKGTKTWWIGSHMEWLNK